MGMSAFDRWLTTDPNDVERPCDTCDEEGDCEYDDCNECPKFDPEYGMPEYDPMEDRD